MWCNSACLWKVPLAFLPANCVLFPSGGSSPTTTPSAWLSIVEKMTGEKIRSLRKDHKPSKDGDLLEPDEEAATGTFTSTKTNSKSRASKIFSNHKLVKSPSTQQHHNQQSQINANTLPTTGDVLDDNNKNPIIRAAGGEDFPVHECVFKGDVRRLSSPIRTQNIAQKDVHGKFNCWSHYEDVDVALKGSWYSNV